jgi:glycine oxidase
MNPSNFPPPDVVVVGAGVIGLSIALRLSQRGAKVVVVDRGEPAREASWAAAGILSPQGEAEGPGPLLDLLRRSEAMFPEFLRELEALAGVHCPYDRRGSLHLARAEEEVTRLEAQRAWQTAMGLAVEAWDARTLRAEEPALAHSFVAANFFSHSGRVQPRPLCEALIAALEKAGVQIRRGAVQALERSGDRVVGLRIEDLLLPASRVVIAAGAWSSLIAGTGLSSGAIEPVRGQLMRLDAPSPKLRRVVFAEGGYALPFTAHSVLAGSTTERVGFDRHVSPAGLAEIRERFDRTCPGGWTAKEWWSGLRPATRDGLPALGPTPIAGLHLAVGHYRNGILLAPLTAMLVAEALLSGAAPAQGPTPQSPESGAIPVPVAASRLYA